MSERLEDLKDQSKTNELLKKYCDVQSTRIDLLEKRLDRLEKLAIINNKIQKRYQMTEGNETPEDIGDDNGNTAIITEGRKDQDLIDKKWREVSELGI